MRKARIAPYLYLLLIKPHTPVREPILRQNEVYINFLLYHASQLT